MKMSRERPRRAATGEQLAAIFACRDREAVGPRRWQVLAEGERDETGALPAGHSTSWGALWRGDTTPDYRDACGYGRWRHP